MGGALLRPRGFGSLRDNRGDCVLVHQLHGVETAQQDRVLVTASNHADELDAVYQVDVYGDTSFLQVAQKLVLQGRLVICHEAFSLEVVEGTRERENVI